MPPSYSVSLGAPMPSIYYSHVGADQGMGGQFDSKLRKATTSMKMLVQNLAPLMQNSEVPKEEVQIFLTSMHGEIEPTLAFLKSYAQKEWARPFLFQNSLHHSTTGFATQQFGILGPAYSICAIQDAQQEALSLALIEGKRTGKPILLVHSESFPEELSEISSYQKVDQCEVLYLGRPTLERLEIVTNPSPSLPVLKSFAELYKLLKNTPRAAEFQVSPNLAFRCEPSAK